MQKRLRVFIDTSALIAGLNSPSGAAGTILSACFIGSVIPVISPQVIEEMDSNIQKKFPKLIQGWTSFLLIPLEVTENPSPADVGHAHSILPTSDAPILASALAAKPDALVTWNTRDFKRKEVLNAATFPILTPGEFLRKFLNEHPLT